MEIKQTTMYIKGIMTAARGRSLRIIRIPFMTPNQRFRDILMQTIEIAKFIG